MEQIRIENARDFGRAVRTARKEAGISQMQLAEMAGCSQRLVSEIERGKQTAEIGKALSLLAELNVRLVTGEERQSIDGRSEVHYAIVRIASELEKTPRKRRSLSEHLKGNSND